jgi:hypothetical protein
VNGRRTPTRFAARSDVAPGDVLSATVRRNSQRAVDPLERAARTGAAVSVVPDGWQWPRWLDRQLRPTHPAHVAPGATRLVENLTGRDWRTIGTLSSGPLALVDQRGLVSPVAGGWSLDWLVGAEDRWHRPARDAGMRQRAVAGAPVLETLCKVPSGDAIQRVFAVNAGGDLGDVVVVEIENASPVPFAIALALRPADLLGAGSISSIAVDEDGRVHVDDRPVLLFEKRPARWAAGTADHDSLVTVVAGAALEEVFAPVSCASGLAQAAFVLPVPHRTAVRCVLRPHAARRQRPSISVKLPDAATTARGWTMHAERGARVELPDPRVNDAYASAVRGLLLAAAAGDVPPPAGREDSWRVEDETRVVRALLRAGFATEAATVLKRCCDELELDSWLRREDPSLARNNAILRTVSELWHLARDRATVDALVAPVVKAAHWNERYRSRNAAAIDASTAYACHDVLAELAGTLRDLDQPEAAEDVAAFAARFVLDFDARPAAPLRLLGGDEGAHLVTSMLGVDTIATFDLAARLATAGAHEALAAIGWLAETGGAALRWPTHVSHRLGSGTAGAGDDPVAAAAVVDLVRALVVSAGGDSLALLPVVPPSWFGQSVDVHGVPTPAGLLSFALRWHGARPALLWELESRPGHAVRLTCPGLDAGWSTDEPKGEALLAAPETHATAAPSTEPGSSFA